jgi:hypothetical protein
MLESAAMDTETLPRPVPALADLPAPRRTAVATLFRDVRRTERELARLYDRFARRTEIPYLRAAFAELAENKRARVETVERLVPCLAPGLADEAPTAAVPAPSGTPEAEVEKRADVFARAFEGERALEVAYRELAALLGDPARCPGLADLAAGSARQRALLRNLYLRYS